MTTLEQMKKWQILYIEDDEDDFILAREMLSHSEGRKIQMVWAASSKVGIEKLAQDHYDAVLVDYDLGLHTGIDIIREFSSSYSGPFILYTGRGSREVDLEAMQAGATLYITKKEANPLLLERAIRYAIELKQKEHELRLSQAQLEQELAERKRVEEALRISEKKFRSVYDAGIVGVVFADPETGRVLDANDEYLRIIGRSRADLDAGQINWKAITPPDVLAQEEKDAANTLPGKARKSYEKIFLRPDNTRIPVIIGGTYLDPKGRRVLACILDNSERKKVEDQVQRYTAELERSNQALQDFASIASHDLKEPLLSIRSFGNLLESDFSQAMGEEGKHFLARIMSSAERMTRMLDSLVAYSHLASYAQPFVEVDLGEIVVEVLADLDPRIQKTGAKIEQGDLPRIEADPSQMRQLFQNLIGNALKYHREGIAPLIILTCQPIDNDRISITVQDHGIGFAVAQADRIFAPFTRLHRSSAYEGTGMGLAICKKIVERHGGTISASSIPDQGSTFTVVIPIKQGK